MNDSEKTPDNLNNACYNNRDNNRHNNRDTNRDTNLPNQPCARTNAANAQDSSDLGSGTAMAHHFRSVATDLELPTRDSTPRAADFDHA